MHVLSGLAWVITIYELLIAFITASFAEKEVSFLTGVVTKRDTSCFFPKLQSPFPSIFTSGSSFDENSNLEKVCTKGQRERERERERLRREREKERKREKNRIIHLPTAGSI